MAKPNTFCPFEAWREITHDQAVALDLQPTDITKHEPTSERPEAHGHVRPTHRYGVLVGEPWFEVSIGEGWRVAYRLLPRAGQAVIGEIRVFPDEQPSFPGRQPGTWSAHFRGVTAECPNGGITSRLLRQIPTRAHLRKFPDLLDWIRTESFKPLADPKRQELRAEVLALVTPATAAGGAPSDPETLQVSMTRTFDANLSRDGFDIHALRRGGIVKGRRDDRFYALLAAAYVNRRASPRPIEDLRADADLRRRLGVPVGEWTTTRLRDALHRARVRGLLMPSQRGIVRGELTAKAHAVLLARHVGAPPRRERKQQEHRRGRKTVKSKKRR